MVFAMTKTGAQYWTERRLGLGELVVISGPAQSTWRIHAPARWGAILVPARVLIDCLHTIAGEQAQVPATGLTIGRPPWSAFRELLALHWAAVHCTVRQPEAPVETEAARALEQQLLVSLADVLGPAVTCN